MSAESQPLPNFFIVGAPKAGTTAIYRYLDQHPQIYMSPIKEPCYFASEIRPENFSEEIQPRIRREMRQLREYLQGPMTTKRFSGLIVERTDYLRLFQNVRDEKAIGEASVCYLWSEAAPGSISSAIPEAKIIMILRDPAERAFSQYAHVVSGGQVKMSFREYLEASLRHSGGKFTPVYPFLEFGMYYEQVKRYLDSFSSDRIRIYFYDDYRRNPLTVLRDIFDFLSVDATFVPDTSEKHLEPSIPRFVATAYLLKRYGVWRRATDLVPPALRRRLRAAVFRPRKSLVLEKRERAYLAEYYREDVQKLSTLLGRDLGGWLACGSS